MLKKRILTNNWGIGLSAEQAAILRNTLGEEHQLTLLSREDWPAVQEESLPAPHIIWMASHCSRDMAAAPESMRKRLSSIPKVILLDDGYSLEDFESACDEGGTEIIRPPLSRTRIMEIVRRSLESQALHHDIECMTREILLERELLERKNDLLSFLVKFLTTSTESLDLEYLLQTAYKGFCALLPIRALHVLLWEHRAGATPSLSLFISSPEDSKACASWRETLLGHAREAVGPLFSVEEIRHLQLHEQPSQWSESQPEDGAVLCLPLQTGKEQFGILLMQTATDRHLGKDQVQALDSAMRHLSLSIKNAMRFRLMQMYADYDALTKVHSRRHFENRLDEEMQRFTRYGQPLSLIMLDIDHFKQVNDTRGHHVGDMVLREVGGIIAQCIRTSDYCARYGGEEFVILLPHTNMKKAHILAERMRKRISKRPLALQCEAPLGVTVSLGIASLTPGDEKNKRALLCEADAALYEAKQSGRNKTCIAVSQPPEAAGRRNAG